VERFPILSVSIMLIVVQMIRAVIYGPIPKEKSVGTVKFPPVDVAKNFRIKLVDSSGIFSEIKKGTWICLPISTMNKRKKLAIILRMSSF
jgi:hypothetical protein